MALDSFQGLEHALGTQAHRWVTITPNNDTDLVEIPKFIYIGGTGGPIACVDKYNNEATFYGAAGQILAIRPKRIKATGTTATPIIACY